MPKVPIRHRSSSTRAAEIARLKREHADTVIPARNAAAEPQRLERGLSDLVNQAYRLTPEEVALMCATAPRHPTERVNHAVACRPNRSSLP